MDLQNKELSRSYSVIERISRRVKKAVIGRDTVIELVLIALFSDGHVLLEDYPGSGKTTLAKALGDSIIDDKPDDQIPGFQRIQFTPDLLPSDVTGITMFDAPSGTFHFRRGPIFAYVVLADEINRTSPKVQSAMLEAMGEKQVTVDDVSHSLDPVFFVIATQNPLDLAGTYPLPVAQLDRFLFKIRMDYIAREDEIQVLSTLRERKAELGGDFPRVNRGEIEEARQLIEKLIHITPEIYECLVDIARAIRLHPSVSQGISTRSLVRMIPAMQVHALMQKRDFLTADDIRALAPYVFQHRIETVPGEEQISQIIEAAMAAPLEQLIQKSLKRS